MTQPELDCILFGFAGGMIAGAWCGYQVRKMFERSVDRRTQEAWVADKQRPRKRDVVTGVVVDRTPRAIGRQDQRADEVLARSNQVIPITRTKRPTPETVSDVDPSDHNVRADVIAALVGAGFKKVKAVTAVDACELRDRTSVESWTVAALKRAAS
jgi:hypothetical protein